MNANKSHRFFVVSSVIAPPTIEAADSRVKKMISGMTNGNPKTAISVALLPAREAMALIVVNKNE